MKKIIILFFLSLFIALFLFISNSSADFSLEQIITYSVCDKPIRYRVDTVDPKFNLSREDFLVNISLASKIWDDAASKSLFVYDPKGDLSINLIYDERQSLTNQITELEEDVKSKKQTLKPQISEYQRLSREFKQKAENLNQAIEFWNSQGGAPAQEYQKLLDRQNELKEEAAQLNNMAGNLNLSANQFNDEVNQLNQTISSFNDTLEERPEEGVYKSSENRIEVYFNINQDELVHTLAHELGHALNLRHNSNPKAIMYSKTSQITLPATEDISDLEYVCRKRSKLEFIPNYLMQLAALVDKKQ